jgi:hypothetical protein
VGYARGKEVGIMAKLKSPNYPAVGLSESIESVRALWNAEKRTSVDAKTAVVAMGYKALSGPAAGRLSALKKYGLVEADGKGVRVSQLAMKIVHNQEGSQDQRQAIVEAANNPEMFRELAATHADASDTALRSLLIVQKGFSESGAKAFISAFRDTLALARGASSGYSSDKSDEEAKTMADGATHERSLGGSLSLGDARGVTAEKAAMRVFSWPLPNNATAELKLIGGPITQEHLEMLRQYLELAKAAVPKAAEGN